MMCVEIDGLRCYNGQYDDCPKAVLYINSLPMKGRARSQVLEDKLVAKTLV